MPVAGPVGLGTMDAVKELNAGGKAVKVIWVDADGFESLASGNEFVLSSVIKEMGKSVEDVVAADVAGKFDSTPYVGTLENGGVSLAPFHDFDSKVPAELKSELGPAEGRHHFGHREGRIAFQPEDQVTQQ